MLLPFGIFHIRAERFLQEVLLNLPLADVAFHASGKNMVLYKTMPLTMDSFGFGFEFFYKPYNMFYILF